MFYLKYIIQKVEHATHFATTSLCDIEELREICITSSLGTFGYIVHNRYRCPTDLVFEAPVSKRFGKGVYILYQNTSIFPNS